MPAPLDLPPAEDFRALVHDLRQPLSAIASCASLLELLVAEVRDRRVRECLESIEDRVGEIETLLLCAARRQAQRQSGAAAETRSFTNAASGALT